MRGWKGSRVREDPMRHSPSELGRLGRTPATAKPPHGNAVLRGPYVMEWFQNTQTGLVRSSVSSRANCTRTGLSRGLGRGVSSLYTTALTTGVLMTGR